ESPEGGSRVTTKGELRACGAPVLGLEPRLAQRPPAPGELLLVPAGELSERDAAVGRLDEPAVADVDRRVEDLGSLGLRAVRAEEDDVGGLQLVEGDPLRARHLDAHRVGRPAAKGRGECSLVRVGLELVDAPDEAGAVVAPAGRDAEV